MPSGFTPAWTQAASHKCITIESPLSHTSRKSYVKLRNVEFCYLMVQ